MLHTVKGFGVVNKAEIDVFLELSCFFHDPSDVGNLVSGSSAFSKTSLNIRKFTVHVLLKPGLESFEHYLTSMWDECNCAVVWAFFGIAFLWDWNETDLFQSCGHCWVFQVWWRIEQGSSPGGETLCPVWNSTCLCILDFPGYLSLPGILLKMDILGHLVWGVAWNSPFLKAPSIQSSWESWEGCYPHLIDGKIEGQRVG